VSVTDDRVLRRDDGSMVVITPIGWDRKVDIGSGMTMLVYPDGTYRIQHTCDRGARGILGSCPALRLGPHAPGHVVKSEDPLTITPSIVCPDCGLHGFVTDGVWRSC